ncbi:MAG: LuxR C-terminal-related transcriptional regulator [Bacteroidota bacterium]
MTEDQHFKPLYEIARHLNEEFTLAAALRKALAKTIEVLGLDSGWIWLVQPDQQSVYLAASHQLPAALARHPERLSGWCYCIEKYLNSQVQQPTNISEIACSRLKDLPESEGMKFHATIPIFSQGEKLGILNLLHEDNCQLNDQQLTLLQTVSELLAIAIQRTRAQLAHQKQVTNESASQRILAKLVHPQLIQVIRELEDDPAAALKQLRALEQQLQLVEEEAQALGKQAEQKTFSYPTSPLTPRETEVLQLVKQGLTNPQIASQLFITERTVKFHISSILGKLEAQTRTEAVEVAVRRGLMGSGG